MEIKLKNCPFCGSPATPPNDFGKVSCGNDWQKCNMALWGMHWSAWNTRALIGDKND